MSAPCGNRDDDRRGGVIRVGEGDLKPHAALGRELGRPPVKGKPRGRRPRPSTSTSRGATGLPSALIAASFAANLTARCRAGRRCAGGVVQLQRREQALREARASLECALQAIDVDEVEADARVSHGY